MKLNTAFHKLLYRIKAAARKRIDRYWLKKGSLGKIPLYIDENINVYTGEEANDRLLIENDTTFLSNGKGIIRVPLERWKKAQNYERKTWMEKALVANDDRNSKHYHYFKQYRPLSRLSFDTAIELGCGPFTNLRLIATKCKILRCTLLDPLIEDYLTHPNCAYNREVLSLKKGLFKAPQNIPIQDILPLPIEQMPLEHQFDLVVMINVIEHCYDIQAIFNTLKTITRPGGYLVFHDKYYAHSEIALGMRTLYDAGHPLRVAGSLIDEFLEQDYVTKFRKIITQNYYFEGDRSYQGLYFIGQAIQ